MYRTLNGYDDRIPSFSVLHFGGAVKQGRRVSPWSDLFRFFEFISRVRRRQFLVLLAFMIVGAASEMATLGAVFAFLSMMTRSESYVCSSVQQWLLSCDMNFQKASIIFIIVVCVASVLRTFLLRSSTRFSYALGEDIGNDVFRRVLYQPYEFHTVTNSSEVIAGIVKVNMLIQQVLNPAMQAIVAIVLSVTIFSTLLSIHAVAATTSALVFALLYSVTAVLTRKLVAKNGKIVAELESLRMKSIQEGLGGIRDVILEGSQRLHVAHFSDINSRQREAQASNTFLKGAPRFIIEAVGMVFIVGLAYFLNLSGSDTSVVPLLGALALGAQKLLPQIQQIYTAFFSLHGSHAVMVDVLALLHRPIPAANAFPAKQVIRRDAYGTPFIRFEDVGFHYINVGKPVFRQVNLDIRKGQCVGLVGQTGSGKSTLVDIILGLLEPTEGAIYIDGERRQKPDLDGWYIRVAHVPQNIFLADTTIWENIAIGCAQERIDQERALEAANRACLSEVLQSLPEGGLTRIGERGVRLSGGQRQRIGIARALYRQADLLVLDEATSALDDTTETAVIDAILNQENAPTIVMIAHRLHTLKRCDAIYRVEAGRVLLVGNYSALVGRGA